jgi:hypothetical protein
MGERTDNVIRLQRHPDGVAAGLRTALCAGRYEIVTAGPNLEFGFIGSDPYGTNAYTGLVVPSTSSNTFGGARYMLLLARASFQSGEQGVRLVGIRQYAELVARVPVGEGGQTATYRREIRSPLWHPPDGDISWHVMMVNRTRRDTRNPANTDGCMYQDSRSPALLYQTIAGPPFAPTAYTPPNGGKPWGTPLAASLGNIHELRYRWRTDQSERTLDIPLPLPCDVLLVASVRQNDVSTNPSSNSFTANQFSALCHEDQFLTAFHEYAKYGAIVGSLVFDQNLGENVP